MTVHKITKLNRRRAKICALESAGLAGVLVSVIRWQLSVSPKVVERLHRGPHLQPAKAAMPAVVFLQRRVKLRLPKIRPQGRRDHQFRVGDLPQEKIAD